MKECYPNKQLVFLLDNLSAHKSNLIMKLIQKKDVAMLLTPSSTP